MESQRNLFFIAWLLVSFVLWNMWENYKNPPAVAPSAQTTSTSSGEFSSAAEKAQLITVKTDVFSLLINASGGDILQVDLLKFDEFLNSKTPLRLLEQTPDFTYVARSGLVGTDGPDNANKGARPLYATEKSVYELADGEDELRVPLTYTDAEGVVFTKYFVFKRNQYVIDLGYNIQNTTARNLDIALFGQIRQSVDIPKIRREKDKSFSLNSYRGTAYSTDSDKYEKYKFGDIEDKALSVTTTGGWVAMLQQYFAVAWIPDQTQVSHFLTDYQREGKIATISFKGNSTVIPANNEQQFLTKLWIGPENQNEMRKVTANLDLTVDYGWLWFLSQPLFKLLTFIQSFVGNWGFSIILITFVVRGVMYPLTKAQYTSMAKMKLLQPKLQEMRERIGDDKQRMSKEMMELYKSEKVNPLGGCLPIFIQMPIFISLYYMLMGSVELRHAPFALWLQDLSTQDPYYILPLLMGGTMFLIQKMSPTPVTDPMQQKIMTYMPVIFTIFFLWFPSGLVLYYTVSNLVTIAQQKMIYHGLEKRGLHSKDKK